MDYYSMMDEVEWIIIFWQRVLTIVGDGRALQRC
jgi:hypothetical protein